MKISASIYANQAKPLQQMVEELDALHIDMLHVDCMDDLRVFDDIHSIRQFSNTPIDLHIISSNPEKYLSLIEELKIEYVSLQFEQLNAKPLLPHLPGTKWGLCVQADTPVAAYEKWLEDFSVLLFMSTTPGVSGGVFQTEKFRAVNQLLGQFPKMQIHVDGGITNEIAFVLRLMGVRAVVSGSYLMNQPSLGVGLMSLYKAGNTNSDLPLSDFCLPAKFLPVLNEHECTFNTILHTIEQHRKGFVLITNQDNMLTGVVTNADIRRALLLAENNLQAVSIQKLINRQPTVLLHSATLGQMIQLINELNFIILFLPIVDTDSKLVGAILLNHLTRI